MARRQVLSALAALGLAAAIAAPGTSTASAASGTRSGAHDDVFRAVSRLHHATLDQRLSSATGQVTAFVQLDAKSGTAVAASGGSPSAVKAARTHTQSLAEDVVPHAITPRTARTAQVKRLGTTTNVVAGELVSGDAAQVRALADDPDVVAIYRVTTKKLDNAQSDGFTKAVQAWTDAHATGKGVRVAVIDTGLDYTHADFGGPGTAEAYATADADDGTDPVPAGTYDAAKFLGGYDFAGPHYDAAADEPGADPAPGASVVPAPDSNPIDGLYTAGNVGHGTHVAGTAAGYGIDAAGHTYDWANDPAPTHVSDWKIGPGTAPQAGLYSFKVFGDAGGSTNLTTLALDRAADPNQDGYFDDRADVVNLSLGSDAGPADSADDLFVDKLSALGTLVVAAAGNGGDVQDISGDPGNAQSALSVANSVGSPQTYDGVKVTTPASLAGTYAAQNSISYTGTSDVTAPVVMPKPTDEYFDGCTVRDDAGDEVGSPFTSSIASRVAGKIVYLWWDDDDLTRACGSAERFTNAFDAGAVGVVLPTTGTVFDAAIAGIAQIPGVQLTKDATDALVPAIEAAPDGTGSKAVTAEIGPGLAGAVVQDLASDVLNPGSSRGDHGSLGRANPDVAAPGTLIVSAAAGSATQAQTLTGTSMASPHVAGIAADVRQVHPGWTPAQVKAAIENTATHDVTTQKGGGLVYGPQRAGSGRVDALAAVTTSVVAYDTARPAEVGVTFGVVDVGTSTVVRSRTVTVRNLGTSATTYATSFARSTTAGGASITVSPARVTVPAGGTATVTVTLRADPRTLTRDLDPTMEPVYIGLLPRDYVTQLTGRLVLTSGSRQLRVPVQAAPRRVSSLSAGTVGLASSTATTAPIALSGSGFDDEDGWQSLTTPLILGATSPRLANQNTTTTSPSAVASGDIRYVGWASNVPRLKADGEDGFGLERLSVGIAVDGDWASLGQAVSPVIDVDVDGDGTPEYETWIEKPDPSVDLTFADTYDPATGELLDASPVNDLFGDVSSGVFDDTVLVAPIYLDSEDVHIPTTAKPRITVRTLSPLAPDGRQIDQAPTFTADLSHPPYWFDEGYGGSSSFVTTGGSTLTLHRASTGLLPKLLLLEHANATPASRAQVVPVVVATATTTRLTAGARPTAGKPLTLTATVAPSAVAGTVAFYDGSKKLATSTVHSGKATASVRLAAGTHKLKAVLTPSSAVYKSSTGTLTVKVARSSSTTKASLSHKSAKHGTKTKASVTVKGASAAPTGKVQVREGHKVLATGTLKVSGTTGKVTITLPKSLKVGTHKLTVVYVGSSNVSTSHANVTYKVHR